MIDLTRREMSGVANNECYAYFLFSLDVFIFPIYLGEVLLIFLNSILY